MCLLLDASSPFRNVKSYSAVCGFRGAGPYRRRRSEQQVVLPHLGQRTVIPFQSAQRNRLRARTDELVRRDQMPHRGRIRAAEREGFFNGFRQPIPKKDAQLCLATSKDLIHWERKGVILPAYKGNWNVGWTKSGAIVPEKINGQCWMYFLGTSPDKTDQTGLVFSTDLIHWTEATQQPVLPKRAGKFDSRVVEPGPPPIVTDRGIVLIYNGTDDRLEYRTGLALFDHDDPRKLLWRSDTPVFWPVRDWEKRGQVPNVVFVEGLVRSSGRYLIYYGGGDKYIGVAETNQIP